MKNLYVIGGPAGSGRTAVGEILKKRLDRCVFLEGDRIWDSEPLLVTEETRRTAVQNIIFLLDSYIRCPDYENIVFSWDLFEQDTIDEILMWINHRDCAVRKISLIGSAGTLEDNAGRLSLYRKLDTFKIDVTEMSPEETADAVMRVRPSEIKFR